VPKAIDFHVEASAEVASAFDWYLEKNERVAFEFLEEIDDAIEKIARSPERWPVAYGNTRRYLLQRFPYAVVYREFPEIIQVLAIAHGRRRAGYWKGRI